MELVLLVCLFIFFVRFLFKERKQAALDELSVISDIKND